jgi:DNA helicase-2/ATP-dependent DNA helicase PcrA
MQHGVEVYNPRGQGLRDIPVVQQLLGLVLECVDPHGHQQGNLRVRAEAQRYLNQWRQAAHAFIQTRPSPNQPHRLSDFVTAWQNRAPQTGTNWPSEWNILELCFKLITWIPMLHNDPEGQVWLEAITRCVAQAATFSPNRSMIRYGAGVHDDNSVRQAIRDILVPIAESAIEVDEEIMPHVPRSRFPIMTIHQAKGLEFPLVIVDVASDYATNSRFNRFRRYPEAASSVQNIEDDLANHCAIGHLRQMRSALDRSFDDLIRLYYVAYSRPESVLLLVGNDVCLRYSTTIRHIATWWRMDEGWPWRMPVPEPHPPPALANNIPLKLI